MFGQQGAGKTTYSRKLADDSNAIRFSIDEWVGERFGPDLPKPIDFRWIMERVQRCEGRIWSTASEIVKRGSNVVLDLGFMKISDRSRFISLAEGDSLAKKLHFVSAPHDVRRSQVIARNASKGDTFAFEVTPAMFDLMENQFEPPTPVERSSGRAVDGHFIQFRLRDTVLLPKQRPNLPADRTRPGKRGPAAHHQPVEIRYCSGFP